STPPSTTSTGTRACATTGARRRGSSRPSGPTRGPSSTRETAARPPSAAARRAAGAATGRPGPCRAASAAMTDGWSRGTAAPGAGAASVSAYPSVVLIAGGRNKGLPFDDVWDAGDGRVRVVVGIGEAGPEIVGGFQARGVPGETAPSMDVAVERAAALARAGD